MVGGNDVRGSSACSMAWRWRYSLERPPSCARRPFQLASPSAHIPQRSCVERERFARPLSQRLADDAEQPAPGNTRAILSSEARSMSGTRLSSTLNATNCGATSLAGDLGEPFGELNGGQAYRRRRSVVARQARRAEHELTLSELSVTPSRQLPHKRRQPAATPCVLAGFKGLGYERFYVFVHVGRWSGVSHRPAAKVSILHLHPIDNSYTGVSRVLPDADP